MASSRGAGGDDDADPKTTRTPSRGVYLGPVIQDRPPRLRFAVGSRPQEFALADAPEFITSISLALALLDLARAKVESLEISLVFGGPSRLYMPLTRAYATDHPHAKDIEADHVRAWLRYGMEHAEKSFVLEVPPPPPTPMDDVKIALRLPASALAATMALTLGNATLTLPAPAGASFHALTDLLLGNAVIVDGGSLGDLLSSPSAFPCLKRLRLEHLVGMARLDLSHDELQELTIVGALHLQRLLVTAACLRTLRVTDCSRLESHNGQLAISAPVLEVLTCSNMCNFQGLQITAPSVREIGKLPLWTHGHADQIGGDPNEASIWIMTYCTTAHSLNLDLHVPQIMKGFLISETTVYSEMEDYANILVEKIPELPNIISLTVTILWSGHSYAASLARLIAQCVNLKELRIDVKRNSNKPTCSDQACVCNNEGGWETQEFSLERLGHLHTTGLQGLDYENRIIQMIQTANPDVQMTVTDA